MKSFLSEFRLYLCNRWVASVPSHLIRMWIYRRVMRFQIGDQSSVFMDCTFDCIGGLTIGTHSVIGARCRLDPRGGLTIGSNVVFASDVTILTADHDIDTPNFMGRQAAVTIDDYVWIGTRAMIMPGVSLGRGAVVGAGSVVTRDVAPFTLVAGVPAKLVRERNCSEFSHTFGYKRLFQ